ncbi:MAG: hypothetical protein UV56_C0016G0005 [Candidatus Woesebacteria bacterium GW2011_GWC1_43_10b]|uniref:Uncharacterized protein n=3 Tax=Microgenomates group TaxID=1794810 RepID=A0A1F4ZS95_9BACT|nr:MAG: hypothetical protein UT23_C0004G0110 [Candidatus Woesebacteria bacterium GW2011_GWA1_39_12]KKS80490.1 MAG: hypothetical protein UV56_C0016G0005 [Candidatus Woesebacteria bacterium GW2011_GWC1_43_10b]OGD09241.1 MAG: hypothetical protein A2395_03930 [Candidatus Amesbacteria bacterium RIFOXYB1_FULL_47_9]
MLILTVIFAQSINIQPGGQFGGLNNITIANLISAGIQILLVVTAIILIVILVAGGIAVMTSGGGDPQKKAGGQKAVTGAIIGLMIVFGAWAIINLVNLFFGINILQLNIPNAQAP